MVIAKVVYMLPTGRQAGLWLVDTRHSFIYHLHWVNSHNALSTEFHQ